MNPQHYKLLVIFKICMIKNKKKMRNVKSVGAFGQESSCPLIIKRKQIEISVSNKVVGGPEMFMLPCVIITMLKQDWPSWDST